ncbi:MAG: hypothetical protein ACYCQK_08420, partial [Acidiferrobacteraceae bacterium]
MQERLRRAIDMLASVDAEHWYIADLESPLSEQQRGVLAQLLDYGPKRDALALHQRIGVVSPRLGTVSPWSSKATDIARRCGLPVRRIERLTAWYGAAAAHAVLPAAAIQAAWP